MDKTYHLKRQKMVCLGPGPLLPRKFLDKFSKTPDVDYVNDELDYPAYAEVLGFKTVNHGMHPGFDKPKKISKYFNCDEHRHVTLKMINKQLAKPDRRRSFHPVKIKIMLSDILTALNNK
jgi:hypothetical protein